MKILIVLFLILSISLPAYADDSDKQDEGLFYLNPETRIESCDIRIIDKAKELTKDDITTYAKAQSICEWVSFYMSIDYDKLKRVTVNTDYWYDYIRANGFGALSAFELKKGVCTDYSELTAALCRSIKIPCRTVVGDLQGYILKHMWNEIYIDGIWINADTLWGLFDTKDFTETHNNKIKSRES